MTTDIWFWFWSLAIYVGLSAILLTRTARAPRQRYVDAWAGAHGLDLDPGERRMVTAWLRRSRWLRAVGFVLPFLSIGLGRTFWGAVNPETPFPLPHRLDWWLALIGYLLGVIVAEVSRRRSPPAPATGQAPVPAGADDRPIAVGGHVSGAGPDLRAAALVPRRLGDYLPAWLPRTTRLVALAAATAGVALVLLPIRSGQGWTDDPVAALGTGLSAVLVAALASCSPGGWSAAVSPSPRDTGSPSTTPCGPRPSTPRPRPAWRWSCCCWPASSTTSSGSMPPSSAGWVSWAAWPASASPSAA